MEYPVKGGNQRFRVWVRNGLKDDGGRITIEHMSVQYDPTNKKDRERWCKNQPVTGEWVRCGNDCRKREFLCLVEKPK